MTYFPKGQYRACALCRKIVGADRELARSAAPSSRPRSHALEVTVIKSGIKHRSAFSACAAALVAGSLLAGLGSTSKWRL